MRSQTRRDVKPCEPGRANRRARTARRSRTPPQRTRTPRCAGLPRRSDPARPERRGCRAAPCGASVQRRGSGSKRGFGYGVNKGAQPRRRRSWAWSMRTSSWRVLLGKLQRTVGVEGTPTRPQKTRGGKKTLAEKDCDAAHEHGARIPQLSQGFNPQSTRPSNQEGESGRRRLHRPRSRSRGPAGGL